MTATVETWTRSALMVPCPLSQCGAEVGQPCTRIRYATVQCREPHQIRRAAAVLAMPELESCEACNAEVGEPCRPGCLGYALAMGELS